MSKTRSLIERMIEFERSRQESLSQPDEEQPSTLDPPKPWPTQFYEDEYRPLPKFVKTVIKYLIIVLGILIILDYGSRHARSSLCQWGWSSNKFCQTGQSDE